MDNTKSCLLRKEYISRINIVQDYIEKNIDKIFTLEELSCISGFSKYHFHRIFGSIMNETLYNYINRLKLEKAVSFLLHAPHKSITEIALDLGFTDSAMFARSFKKYYKMSATEYRRTYSNNSKRESKIRKAENMPPRYNEAEITNNWRQHKMNIKCKVDVVDVEEMTVIYLRHVGTYLELGKVFHNMIGRLVTWASSHGLIGEEGPKLIAVYHDNPEITEDEKRRTSICLVVPKDTKVDGDIGKMTINAGKYAIGHFEIDDNAAAQQHSNAWQYLFSEWLPESGFQPDDGPNFEMYLNDPNTHPERKHFLDIYLPVKPL